MYILKSLGAKVKIFKLEGLKKFIFYKINIFSYKSTPNISKYPKKYRYHAHLIEIKSHDRIRHIFSTSIHLVWDVKGRDPKGERGAKHLPSHKLIPTLITFVSWTIDGLVNPCCWAGPFFLLSILGKWINKYQLYLHIYLPAHARSNRDGVVNTLLSVQTSPRLGWGGVAHTNTSADLELFSLKK